MHTDPVVSFRKRLLAGAALLVCAVPAAFAHDAGGVASGFAHPFAGADHLAAMLAVGLWAASLGRTATWTLPIVFAAVMAVGSTFAVLGAGAPAVEAGIVASVVVLGLMVALATRPPLWVAATLVGVFAVFHGLAHGAALPPGAAAGPYVAGFLGATMLLQVAGIAVARLASRPAGRLAVRIGGAGLALAGTGALLGAA